MYIDNLEINRFRCFEHSKIAFQYPGCPTGPTGPPRLPNVNLILGDNGTGKSALLKALALSVLGRVLNNGGFRPYLLVRRTGRNFAQSDPPEGKSTEVRARVVFHKQDNYPAPEDWSEGALITHRTTTTVINRILSTETFEHTGHDVPSWKGLYDDNAPAFFLAAYGATRRVEDAENYDSAARNKARSPRYQRIAGLFEDGISLAPVSFWRQEMHSRQRIAQATQLLNALLPEDVRLREQDNTTGDLLFAVRATPLPFSALSDGYRSFIGWVTDMLLQMAQVTPSHYNLIDLRGVVIVDEVDLLLHPAWQRVVIERIATTFPLIQFFFTSHSPIVAGTLQAANIIITEVDEETGAVNLKKSREGVFGLSADQVLSSPYFGLPTSRAQEAGRQLNDLAEQAWAGDNDAAAEYLRRLADGFDLNGSDGVAIERSKRSNGERRHR